MLAFCLIFWHYLIKGIRWLIVALSLVLLVFVIGCKAIDSQTMIIPAKVGYIAKGNCCYKVSFVFKLGNRNYIEQIKVSKEKAEELKKHVSDDVLIRVAVFINQLNEGFISIAYDEEYSTEKRIDTQEAKDLITEFRFKDPRERDPIALAGYERYWDPEGYKEKQKREMARKIIEEDIKDPDMITPTTIYDANEWKE